MPAEAALRPRPDGRNRLAAHGRTSHSGSPDRNAAARTDPRRKKLLSFHGESFEICRGHPLRSRASRMARRRTAGRKTPGRNGFGSKDRRMSSYKHHRFPGYVRFLIRSVLFPTTAPAPCPAACDAFRHPASSFRTGRREHRTTLSALRTAIRKRPRPFPPETSGTHAARKQRTANRRNHPVFRKIIDRTVGYPKNIHLLCIPKITGIRTSHFGRNRSM